MMIFFCEKCHNIFENEGQKTEYYSVTYGPCFKYTAICSVCKTESDEYRNTLKKKSTSAEYPSCNNGGRCSCCG